MDEIDRKTGILSPGDRRYLLHGDRPLNNTDDYKNPRQADYQQRKGMRDRILSGLADFPAIWLLPAEERRKLFDDMGGEGGDRYYSLIAATAFFKRACDDAGLSFERMVEEALIQVERTADAEQVDEPNGGEGGRPQMLDEVNVSIEYQYRDVYYVDTLLERWRDGEDLDPTEMGILVQSDEFGPDDVKKLKERKAAKSGEE